MMESRKPSPARSSTLPVDYLKMVNEVFATNFDDGLNALKKLQGSASHFEASGEIHPSEILLCVSLLNDKQLSATSVYASCDFDPKASAPTVEDLLAACVDAIGALYQDLLNPKNKKRLEQITDESLAALEDVPYQWTPYQIEKHKIFLRVDKANPKLDQMTDDWLAKHDPELRQRETEEEEQTKGRFFSGPKNLDPKELGDDEEPEDSTSPKGRKTKLH